MDLVTLKKSTREVNHNWEVIELLEKNLLQQGNEWIQEMALQGKRLLAIKAGLKHGQWLPWVEANCPGRYEKVKQCVRIAANWERVPGLSQAESLRQALALCQPNEPNAATETKRWPAHIEAGLRLSKFVGFVDRCPIEQWPEESQEKAREELLPVVTVLWPERF